MNKRNMAMSRPTMTKFPEAVWSEWRVDKAVAEGYKVSGWVYRAIGIIARNVSSVPYYVIETETKEKMLDHPVSKVLAYPNSQFSKQDFFELLASWQQLTGMAYAKKVTVGGVTKELWPVSPDRLQPVTSKDVSKILGGYQVLSNSGVFQDSLEYTPENVVDFKFLDPANPLVGIGPLQVAARVVDVDVSQQNWNYSAMKNKGMLEGIFTFKRELSPTMYATIKETIKEMFWNTKSARDIGVIGSEATYQRLSLTPAEMDFIASRRFNREEIYAIFGFPPQLGGSEESSSYNNFTVANRIFWEMTLIPILRDMQYTLNRSFRDELDNEKYTIVFDVSHIAALKQDQKEQAEVAKAYSAMGVPMKTINTYLDLGIEEYPDWDKPWKKSASKEELSERSVHSTLRNTRTLSENQDLRNQLETKHVTSFKLALSDARTQVFAALSAGTDTTGAVLAARASMVAALSSAITNTANTFSEIETAKEKQQTVSAETREFNPILTALINEFLEEEGVILTEISLIEKTTMEAILEATLRGEKEGLTITDIQQSLIDAGIFSPERALRIARTTIGVAQSIGQMTGALSLGATKKTWLDAGNNVRDIHAARNGETVGIHEQFSSQILGSIPPRWPSDQRASAADRINCRCSLTFS